MGECQRISPFSPTDGLIESTRSAWPNLASQLRLALNVLVRTASAPLARSFLMDRDDRFRWLKHQSTGMVFLIQACSDQPGSSASRSRARTESRSISSRIRGRAVRDGENRRGRSRIDRRGD